MANRSLVSPGAPGLATRLGRQYPTQGEVTLIALQQKQRQQAAEAQAQQKVREFNIKLVNEEALRSSERLGKTYAGDQPYLEKRVNDGVFSAGNLARNSSDYMTQGDLGRIQEDINIEVRASKKFNDLMAGSKDLLEDEGINSDYVSQVFREEAEKPIMERNLSRLEQIRSDHRALDYSSVSKEVVDELGLFTTVGFIPENVGGNDMVKTLYEKASVLSVKGPDGKLRFRNDQQTRDVLKNLYPKVRTIIEGEIAEGKTEQEAFATLFPDQMFFADKSGSSIKNVGSGGTTVNIGSPQQAATNMYADPTNAEALVALAKSATDPKTGQLSNADAFIEDGHLVIQTKFQKYGGMNKLYDGDTIKISLDDPNYAIHAANIANQILKNQGTGTKNRLETQTIEDLQNTLEGERPKAEY